MTLDRKLKTSEKCSRCPREQERIVTIEEAIEFAKRNNQPVKPAFTLLIDGEQVVEFSFLCDECRSAILGYVGGAAQKLTKVSSKRTAKAGKKKEAPAAKVAPTPPQPTPATTRMTQPPPKR